MLETVHLLLFALQLQLHIFTFKVVQMTGHNDVGIELDPLELFKVLTTGRWIIIKPAKPSLSFAQMDSRNRLLLGISRGSIHLYRFKIIIKYSTENGKFIYGFITCVHVLQQ